MWVKHFVVALVVVTPRKLVSNVEFCFGSKNWAQWVLLEPEPYWPVV